MAYLSKEKRREQLMNAVVAIVLREGLAAATVRQIAQDLECSPGQVHHHFASAEALRAAAVREVWQRLEPELHAALQHMPPYERLLTLLCGHHSPHAGEVGEALRLAERLWKEAWDIRHEADLREAIAEGFEQLHTALLDTLSEGVEQGMFPAGLDVVAVAMRLMTAAQGFDLFLEVGAPKACADDKLCFVKDLMMREGLRADGARYSSL